MRRGRLIWHIYPAFLFLILVCLAAIAWYSAGSMGSFYEGHIERSLRDRARLMAAQVRERMESGRRESLQSMAGVLGEATSTRYTVILVDGSVIADSMAELEGMENHAGRQEVVRALRDGYGASTRPSTTIGRRMMYVAIPLTVGDEVVGVIRASVPLTEVEQRIGAMHLRIVVAGLIVAVAGGILALLVSRRISRPIQEMRDAAGRFARGDLTHKLIPPDSEELGSLAEAMNQMAGQLDDRIRAIDRQQTEMAAILSSMVEGVIAVDSGEKIISLNHAAAELLSVEDAEATGRPLAEIVRNADLMTFVARSLAASEPVKDEIVFHAGAERIIEAHGTLLADEKGHELGAVIVLHDVTHLRRLENVRRDFVANVSHELRTPITSINGFVETLLGGAMRDPADCERFLKIICRQANRLNTLTEDLLTLSSIEQTGGYSRIQPVEGKIREVLETALEICETRAKEKGTELRLACDTDLSTRFMPALIEQAVVNLVDNAVKYSPPGSSVDIEAGTEAGEVFIRVRDAGSGVPLDEQERIFERFYRVDKARSRSLGGTGLGLSIVKHIMQAHGGTVTVKSKLGEGSVFTLRLPK